MWRLQAKHETVCPRCKGYIKKAVGSFKTRATADGASGVPGDVQARKAVKAEPTTYLEYVPDEDGNLIEVERTLE